MTEHGAAVGPATRQRALVALGLTYLVMALDVTMLGGAAPRLAGDLRGLDLLGWLFTAFLLGWTIAGPLFGRLADIYGRRPALLAGLGCHATAALLATQVVTMEQAIACRLLAGIGAGVLMGVCYTAGADLYPPRDRARAQVLFAVVYLLAAAVGPPLTGYLVSTVSWRAIFVVDLVLQAAAAVALRMLFAEQVTRRPHRLDLPGAATLAVGTGALLLALAVASRTGDWAAPPVLGLGAASAAGLIAFVVVERHAPEPLVPFGLFRTRVVLGACLVTLLMGSCLWSISAFVPLQVQGVLALGTFEASFPFTPYNATWLATAMLAVPLLWRWGYRQMSLVGMATVAAGFGVLALVSRDGPAPYLLILLGVSVVGLGLGFANTAVTVAVQNAVPWTERASVTAVQQLFRQFGPSFSIAVLQTVLNARLASELAAGGISGEQLAAAGVGRVAQANALLAPDLTARLTPPVLDAMRGALDVALHQTFGLIAAIGVLGCLAVWLLPGGHPSAHVFRDEPAAAASPD
jgi:MFS family permease